MTTDFLLFHLPNEPLRYLALGGWITLFIGLTLWLFGVAIARAAVAGMLGAVGGALGALVLTKGVDLAPLTGGILGFVAGVLLGAFVFRYVQALTLALVLGLAVAGLYYRWHIADAPPPPAPATVQAEDLLIQLPQHADPGPREFLLSTVRTIGQIPPTHLHRMLIAGAGMAFVGMLIALGFPRATTAAITSLVGSGLILASTYALVFIHAEPYAHFFPSSNLPRYLLLALLTATGLAIQYRFFGPKTDKPSKTPAPAPPAAQPSPT